MAVTVSATLATAPLLAHHFGSVPLAGLPANLLALPAVAPAMWIGMLEAALGQLSAPGVPAPAAPAMPARALGAVVSLPLAYLSGLAERPPTRPVGSSALPLPSYQAVVAAYALLGAVALVLARWARAFDAALPTWAARWRATPRARRRARLPPHWQPSRWSVAASGARPSAPDRLTIRFLDVGQGDAVLIQLPTARPSCSTAALPRAASRGC